jgi:hypothetical protein
MRADNLRMPKVLSRTLLNRVCSTPTTPKLFRSVTIIWTILSVWLLPNFGSASLYCPSSFAILSSDNQFLLVMRSTVGIESDQGRIFKLPSGQEVDLREKFQTNGVFRLDTFECVQPLNWFADAGELFASGDFKLLVRLNRFAVEDQRQTNWCWCLKFYNKGKEVKQYQVGDLVGIPKMLFLPYTSSGWHSVWYATAMYTDSSAYIDVQHSYSSYNQFILVTAPQSFGRFHLTDGNVFLFNANNGEIWQQWRHHPLMEFSVIAVGFLAVLLLGLVMVFWLMREVLRWKNQK